MGWLAVTLTVNAAHIEKLSDALLEAGALAVDVVDADAGTPRERASFDEPGEADTPAWEIARISALFAESADVGASVAAALGVAGLDPVQDFEITTVADRDWVRATQAQFGPLQVSQRLWVVPSWHTPPDPEAVNLIIDPGLAFGTGTHPTTRLCLIWLDANLHGGETVLDYGCGSGILAIAAAKLGASGVRGADIDPAALLAARHNAMQNQVAVEFETAGRAIAEPADIVLANILANPLKLLAPLLARATRSGGHIALSGILAPQAAEVRDAYGGWFDMDGELHDEGWVLLHGTRRPD
ncbi:MAG TPA: 50S ribosomal protein L11 methyltransferase [Burkholderiales bacterium]|nr:50S ribosomal protein L11 methyltransferase [Burkholderiales bacterium]